MPLKFFSLRFVLLASIFTVLSCAKQTETDQLQLAGNRTMAIVLKGIMKGEQFVSDRSLINYLLPLTRSAIEQSFQSDLSYISLEGGNLLQSPNNLHKIASNDIDDLLIVTLKVPEDFTIPETAAVANEIGPGMNQASPEEQSLINQSKQILLTIDVVNGANLNTAARIQASTAYATKEIFESNFISNFRTSAGQAWPNPNIYPKSDSLYFANLLFDYSQEREKQAQTSLTCDMAEDYLEFYEKASELYEKAKTRLSEDLVAQQEKMHELNLKIEESNRKAEILQKCRVDKTLKFKLDVEVIGLDPENAPFIERAVETAKLKQLLQKYTDKPAKIQFSATNAGGIQIDLYTRFHPDRYMTWLKQLQTPSIYRGYHVLSLEPYHALMKTMVFLRTRLPAQAPATLKREFVTAGIRVHLDTLMNGEVAFGVNGRFLEREKTVDLFSPNGVLISLENFEDDTIFTRSEEIFQDKGWISLSSCKTLEGTLTQDGLVMKFFGLPCRL